VVPEASLLAEARRLFSESAVISPIILAVAVSLVSLLALRLFEPLRKLVRNTERVKQMRFAEVEPVWSRFVEIQAMDAAISGIRQSLDTLERYVPAAVARRLMASGAGPSPGAEVVGLTLFCGGMAEFGRLCRAVPPERIAAVDEEGLKAGRGLGRRREDLQRPVRGAPGPPLPAPDSPPLRRTQPPGLSGRDRSGPDRGPGRGGMSRAADRGRVRRRTPRPGGLLC